MSAVWEHGGRLTIDLGALADNWRLLRDIARQKDGEARAGAVVKADAYGIGIEPAVRALAKAGCETFFVAHLSEGQRVRKTAPLSAVYVLNGFPPGSAQAYLDAALIPTVGSLEEAREWLEAGGGQPCAIHIDTGMNRLGFAMDILGEKLLTDLNSSLVLSHFSASEVPSEPSNASQIAKFTEIAKYFPDTPKSLLNSSGHFLDAAPAYDLTRPGYALYGGNPTPGRPNPMKPVIGLEACILQLRDVEAGTRVGYNGTWTAPRRSRLATISLGYADGYARNASAADGQTGGAALIGGILCPFVGTVSMDLIIVDVSHVPAADLRRGASATIIGGPLDIDRVGSGARTIGYEMLTSLGKRYHRHYIEG